MSISFFAKTKKYNGCMSDEYPVVGHSKKIRATVNDARRLDAVKKTNLVDSDEDETFDRLTRLASKLLKTPISFVTILEKDRDFLKSQFGLPAQLAKSREITAHPSFCQHIVASGEPLILEDARDSEIFRHFPSVQSLGVVAYAGVPLTTQQGIVLGTCCVVDYKKRIWTSDELEILEELSKSILTEIELRQAAAALDAFVLIAAHEVKTPLTSLKTYTQLLRHKLSINDATDINLFVEKIGDQVHRMESLVNRLFDTRAMKNGELNLRKESWDMNRNVAETVNSFESQSSKKFVLNYAQPSLIVHADKDKITQVLSNLIGNALKYAPLSESIEISVHQTDSDAVVSVRDFGYGISKADSNKIFERYYRVRADTKTIGLGLGLYICSDIIKAHDGVLTVQSELGVGSIFSFSLPLQKNHKESENVDKQGGKF